MSQKFTILFDLDGTLVNSAPDLMRAHNHVMKKYGYGERNLADIKNANEQAIPPNGGMSLVESRFSFSFLFKFIFFEYL